MLESGENYTKEQRIKILKGIQEDSDWLMRMVENLLSITRIDEGKIKIIKTPTVLDELIDSVMVKFHKRYPQQEVYLDLPEDIIIIPMDAILIEQVIFNLLENAVLHAEGMTKLALKVFVLGKQVVFEVSDNGCGIEKERLNGIFNGSYHLFEGRTPSSDVKNTIPVSDFLFARQLLKPMTAPSQLKTILSAVLFSDFRLI